MQSLNCNVTLASWNVRGINNRVKRFKVFSYLKSISADIIFLQETHIKHNEQRLLRCNWVSQVFQSTFSCRARGVAILFRRTIPFKHISTISDPNGRYVIVSGLIFSVHITLLNLYGPNYDDPSFFRKVFNLLPNLSNTHLIIGGDFNLVLDPTLDRTPARSVGHLPNSTSTLNELTNSYDLVDIWRLNHPTDTQYTFFSNVHSSYSRIDFFLADFKVASCVTAIKHHNRIISDHSAVTISLDLFEIKPSYSWRFNPTLLFDSHFSQRVTEWLDEYLMFNDTGEVSDSTLWESLKAVLRGYIISYESSLKKQRQKCLSVIEARLNQLEHLHVDSADPEVLKEIAALKLEYNTIFSKQISNMLLKIKQKQFELGDKPDRLLARQLRSIQANRAIHQIRKKDGTLTTNPSDINKCFKEFYEALYESRSPHCPYNPFPLSSITTSPQIR